jgi:four helix bundle protein
MGGTYHDLKVWQSAMELTVKIYRVSERFPAHELYGLSSQLRRAVVSVASNIAEGKGRSSDKELLQFLSHARGSTYEVQTQLQIAQALGYLPASESQELLRQAESVGRMLNGMMTKFRQAIQNPNPEPKAQSLKPKA